MSRKFIVSPLWKKALVKKYGEEKAGDLEEKIMARYASLYQVRPHFKQAALRNHLEAKILPGIALYQALKEELGSQAAALAGVDEIFAEEIASTGQRRSLLMMGHLPDAFSLLSVASRLQVAVAFPKEGWTMKTVINDHDTLGFDTTHCLYVDILKTYQVPELAPSFCMSDFYLMKDLPYVHFERSMTLGQGDPLCNFRYSRVMPAKTDKNI